MDSVYFKIGVCLTNRFLSSTWRIEMTRIFGKLLESDEAGLFAILINEHKYSALVM